jgi:hypothetical protein
MIKVSVLYPNSPGAKFDIPNYTNTQPVLQISQITL